MKEEGNIRTKLNCFSLIKRNFETVPKELGQENLNFKCKLS